MMNRSLKASELLDTHGPGMKKADRRSSAPPSLVEMDEVTLDGNELCGLTRMLAHQAKHVIVRIKRRAASDHHEAITLPELAPLLLKGDVFGAQLQYSFNSSRWLDTLVVTREGFRLVRVKIG